LGWNLINYAVWDGNGEGEKEEEDCLQSVSVVGPLNWIDDNRVWRRFVIGVFWFWNVCVIFAKRVAQANLVLL